MRARTFLLILLGLVLIQACTVGYSFTGADIPADANSFSVKMFKTATPMAAANYDIRITEALKDLMLAQTRLDLVEKRGDLQYEGVITRYESSNAAVSGEEYTTVNRLTITIQVKYANTLEREKSFERTFTRFADYSSSQDFSTVEDELIREINAQITQDIFDASLGAW